MNKGMIRCQECGKWYSDHTKLDYHLINKHGYVIKIDEEENDKVED